MAVIMAVSRLEVAVKLEITAHVSSPELILKRERLCHSSRAGNLLGLG